METPTPLIVRRRAAELVRKIEAQRQTPGILPQASSLSNALTPFVTDFPEVTPSDFMALLCAIDRALLALYVGDGPNPFFEE